MKRFYMNFYLWFAICMSITMAGLFLSIFWLGLFDHDRIVCVDMNSIGEYWWEFVIFNTIFVLIIVFFIIGVKRERYGD